MGEGTSTPTPPAVNGIKPPGWPQEEWDAFVQSQGGTVAPKDILGLKDFEGSFIIGPDGSPGVLKWSVDRAGVDPLSGWTFVPADGSGAYPVPPGFTFKNNFGVVYQTGKEGTVTDQRDLKDDGGSGSGHVPTPYGYTAPDYTGAMNGIIAMISNEIAMSNGKFDAENAIAKFQAEWDKYLSDVAYNQANLTVNTNDINAAQNRAENQDRMQREINEANRRVMVAQEAGSRAKTVASMLPSMIPGATSMNLPLLGNVPLSQINLGSFFSQGGAGDLNKLPGINPNPANPYSSYETPVLPTPGPMPTLPTVPTYPSIPPQFKDLVDKAAAGSGPMGWY